MKNILIYCILIIGCWGCVQSPDNYVNSEGEVEIFPDYKEVVIPPNICPLNFEFREENYENLEACFAKLFIEGNSDTLEVSGKSIIRISEKNWAKLIRQNKGKTLKVITFTKNKKRWTKYPTFDIKIATDTIDPFVVFRYYKGNYNTLGFNNIMQRDLTSFEEKVIIGNDLEPGACINCHSFNQGNPNTMQLHVRFTNSGTLVYKNGEFKKINTSTPEMKITGTYPSWHPSGKFIAYSLNAVTPSLTTNPHQYMEAFDTASDIMILNVENNEFLTCPSLKEFNYGETQPCWSKNGDYLYFARCTKPSLVGDGTSTSGIKMLNNIHYDLVRVSFDANSFTFGEVEILLSYKQTGKSVSLPRVSPDGKNILFCLHSRGTFASWHKDSDLYIYNIETKEYYPCQGWNAKGADSYHSWSQNNRWVAFASKRNDGFYTRIYLGYIDTNGKTYKPFIIPQKNPFSHRSDVFFHNIPELITSAIPINAKTFASIIQNYAAQPAKYVFTGGSEDTSRWDAQSGATPTPPENEKKKFE